MPHTKCDCFKPPPDANLAIADRPIHYDLSKSSSVISVKLKYEELCTGLSVKALVTSISPRKAHLFDFLDVLDTRLIAEVLVGEEISIKALAPYPVNVLIKVLHGEVKLSLYFRQNSDVELPPPAHEIFVSSELVPICLLTEVLIIESVSKFAILTIAAFF